MLVSCEHAGNAVPPEHAGLFEHAGADLASHRGWDIGALGYALRLAEGISAPLLATAATRLLVEVNRSPGHPGVFSAWTGGCDAATKQSMLDRYYLPHRRAVERLVRAGVERGERVLHLGAHSFADVLDGVARGVDIGLLFDPDRAAESGVCHGWRKSLERAAPSLRARFNEPYLGIDDGLTTWLRGRLPEDLYAGIEVEVRQGLLETPEAQDTIGDLLSASLADARLV